MYERWQTAGLLEKISSDSARLLAAGILDNTLNFQANVTTDRDRTAYKQLAKLANLPADWPVQYFSECQLSIESNLEKAVKNDAKIMEPTLNLPNALGQLVIWDGRYILQHKSDIIAAILQNKSVDWILNLISISEGKSYFMARNVLSQRKFENLLGVKFFNGIASAERLWLRKEILKQAILS